MADVKSGPLVEQTDEVKAQIKEATIDTRSTEESMTVLLEKMDELIEAVREITNR